MVFHPAFRAALLSVAFVLVSTALAAQQSSPSQGERSNRPNVVLIMTDDQGYGDLAVHGNPWIQTPRLDALAAEGARFDRFFVEPVCAPTRAALLTGRYPTRTGVHGVTRGQENMRGEEVTIAEILRDRLGYETGCFGKWHNGAHGPYHPNEQGFDTFVGFCGGHWNDYYDPILERNGEDFQARGFIADVLAEEAIAFLETCQEIGQPAFCYVPFNTPHTPSSVAPRDWERWADHEEVESPFVRAMYALCENLDRNVGRILDSLDALGMAENTIVLFLTDNGANGARFNAGMKGYKGSVDEGGVRVPLFIRWPGQIEAGLQITDPSAPIDLLPTLCALIGEPVEADPDRPIDGRDLSALLLGEGEKPSKERNFYTWRNSKKWSVRSHQYRATARTLHDLFEDPGQERNLASSKPEVHRRLVDAYGSWEEEAVPAVLHPLPVCIGYGDRKRLVLNAHELQVVPDTGEGIDYCSSRGFANQWIERWSDSDAYAECPVQVVEGGTYRVSLRYACPPDSVGASMRIDLGEARLPFTVEEAWVSAPYPASEQGPKAPNGYLSREWHDVEVGEMTLAAGDANLVLRGLERKGPQFPEVKAILFEKR